MARMGAEPSKKALTEVVLGSWIGALLVLYSIAIYSKTHDLLHDNLTWSFVTWVPFWATSALFAPYMIALHAPKSRCLLYLYTFLAAWWGLGILCWILYYPR